MAADYRSSTKVTGPAASSYVIAKPAGAVVGDVLYCWVAIDGIGANDLVAAITDGTNGFVGIGPLSSGAVLRQSATTTLCLWRRVVTGAEGANFTITFNAGATCAASAVCICAQGVDTTPEDAAAAGNDGGAATSVSVVAPSVTAATANTLRISGFASDLSIAANAYTIGTMTEREDIGTASRTPLMVATESVAAAGATGTRTATASASQEWVAGTVIVRTLVVKTTPTTVGAVASVPAPTVTASGKATPSTVAAVASVPAPTPSVGLDQATAWWVAKQNSAGDLVDQSGHGHTWDSQGTSPVFGADSGYSVAQLVKTDPDYFTTADHADFQPGAGDFTLIVVAKPTLLSGTLYWAWRFGAHGYWLFTSGTTASGLVYNGTDSLNPTGAALSTGTRYVVALVRSGTQVRVVVDGVAGTPLTLTAPGATVGDAATFEFSSGGTTNAFDGSLYGAAFFKIGLTNAQSVGAGNALLAADAAGSSATTTPSVVAAVATVPSPTETASGVASSATVAAVASVPTVTPKATATVPAAVVAAVAAVPAPTITASAKPTPTTVTAVASVPVPTLRASATITSTTVAAIASVPAPTLRASATLTTSTVTAVAAVEAPTLRSSATLTPATVAGVASIPSVTVTAGSSSTVTASTVTAVASIGSPVLTATANLTPATVQAVAQVPAPSLVAYGIAAATTVTAVATVPSSAPAATGSTTPSTVEAVASVGGVTLTSSAVLTPATVLAVAYVLAPSLVISITVNPTTVVAVAWVGTPQILTPVLETAAVYERTYALNARRSYELDARRTYALSAARTYEVEADRSYPLSAGRTYHV